MMMMASSPSPAPSPSPPPPATTARSNSRVQVAPRGRAATVAAPGDNTVTIKQPSSPPPPPAPPEVTTVKDDTTNVVRPTSAASSTTTPSPKQIKIGNYIIGHTIGKGHSAVVKMATHALTKQRVAIKMFDRTVLDPDKEKRLRREIDSMKHLNRHPNIIRLYEIMETPKLICLVTEYACNDYIIQKKRLSEREARSIFRQIVSAVNFCHQNNIVHRDIKVENVLIDLSSSNTSSQTPSGPTCPNCNNNNASSSAAVKKRRTVKLADFGFSGTFRAGELLDVWCGSPPYCAPELFLGKLYDGPKVDLWALGVLLYVLVCGNLPFEAQYYDALYMQVTTGAYRVPFYLTAECKSLIEGLLCVDVERRFGMQDIFAHKWFNTSGTSALGGNRKVTFDDEAVVERTSRHNSDFGSLINKIEHISIQNSTSNNEPASPPIVTASPPDTSSSNIDQRVLDELQHTYGLAPAALQHVADSVRHNEFDSHAAMYYLVESKLSSSTPTSSSSSTCCSCGAHLPSEPPSGVNHRKHSLFTTHASHAAQQQHKRPYIEQQQQTSLLRPVRHSISTGVSPPPTAETPTTEDNLDSFRMRQGQFLYEQQQQLAEFQLKQQQQRRSTPAASSSFSKPQVTSFTLSPVTAPPPPTTTKEPEDEEELSSYLSSLSRYNSLRRHTISQTTPPSQAALEAAAARPQPNRFQARNITEPMSMPRKQSATLPSDAAASHSFATTATASSCDFEDEDDLVADELDDDATSLKKASVVPKMQRRRLSHQFNVTHHHGYGDSPQANILLKSTDNLLLLGKQQQMLGKTAAAAAGASKTTTSLLSSSFNTAAAVAKDDDDQLEYEDEDDDDEEQQAQHMHDTFYQHHHHSDAMAAAAAPSPMMMTMMAMMLQMQEQQQLLTPSINNNRRASDGNPLFLPPPPVSPQQQQQPPVRGSITSGMPLKQQHQLQLHVPDDMPPPPPPALQQQTSRENSLKLSSRRSSRGGTGVRHEPYSAVAAAALSSPDTSPSSSSSSTNSTAPAPPPSGSGSALLNPLQRAHLERIYYESIGGGAAAPETTEEDASMLHMIQEEHHHQHHHNAAEEQQLEYLLAQIRANQNKN